MEQASKFLKYYIGNNNLLVIYRNQQRPTNSSSKLYNAQNKIRKKSLNFAKKEIGE